MANYLDIEAARILSLINTSILDGSNKEVLKSAPNESVERILKIYTELTISNSRNAIDVEFEEDEQGFEDRRYYDKVSKYIFSEHFQEQVLSLNKQIIQDKISSALSRDRKAASKVKKKTSKLIKYNVPGIKGRTQALSLVNLKQILQFSIYAEVVRNMGRGERKDVLNFRSGRFAASAQVRRVTLQRDGVLNIFYSYMEYPYATFESGGLQGSPLSRSPKALISKSIRNIATTLVKNRLRTTIE
jgi:hypothetical protein